jgi:hypothetical protein
MIYVWGLVSSKKMKEVASHAINANRGRFCPSYGKLGARLMATNGAPLLLLSATCRPIAIASILDSLKLTERQVHFVCGELTRPEIQILCIPMEKFLALSNNLLKLFPCIEDTPNEEIVPTLIYSCTKNLTTVGDSVGLKSFSSSLSSKWSECESSWSCLLATCCILYI